MMTETNVKLLELFKEAVPSLLRIAVVWDPDTPRIDRDRSLSRWRRKPWGFRFNRWRCPVRRIMRVPLRQ